jgi:hypothetical protein
MVDVSYPRRSYSERHGHKEVDPSLDPEKLYLEIATGQEGVDVIKKDDLLFIMKIYECTYKKGNYQEKDSFIPVKGKFYMNEFRKDFLYD